MKLTTKSHTNRNRSLWLCGILLLALLILPAANAAPPVTTIVSSNTNMQIVSVPFQTIKLNTTLYSRFWAFNGSTGTLLKNTSVYCTVNLFEPQGRNTFKQEFAQFGVLGNPNACQNCFAVDIAPGNFSQKGYYGLNLRCQTYDNISLGGDSMQIFEVTNTGIEPATDTMIIFSYLMFFAVIALFLYLLVYSLEQFALMKFDMKDLIYNILAYIFLHITNIFNTQYFGIETLKPILTTFIVVGVFSMIAIPVYMFIMCYVKRIFTENIDTKMGRKW